MKGLILALCLLPQFGERDLNHLRDYGVKIHIVMGDEEGSGSGVYVDDDLILSANHLYFEGSRFYLDDEHTQEASIVRWDEDNDLLLLRVSKKHKHATLGYRPQKMATVYTVGHPMGSNQMMIKGYVVDLTDKALLIDGTTIRGMSGGAVYSEDGRLIGICSRAWGDKDQQFMVATSIEVIRKFLKGP